MPGRGTGLIDVLRAQHQQPVPQRVAQQLLEAGPRGPVVRGLHRVVHHRTRSVERLVRHLGQRHGIRRLEGAGDRAGDRAAAVQPPPLTMCIARGSGSVYRRDCLG